MAVEPKYRCKQVELYSVALAGIHSFSEYKADFEAFKGKYADPYETDMRTLLSTAMSRPGFQVRDMDTEVLGIQLKTFAERCLDNWQALKRYIKDVKAWEDLQKPRLEGAGSQEYAKAAALNWESVLLLNQMGLEFIERFETELLADNNMPAGFKNAYTQDKDRYAQMYNSLLDAKHDNPTEAENKVIANNELFEALMGMFDDGAFIFKRRKSVKDRFTWAQVLNKVRRPSVGTPPPTPDPGTGTGTVSGTMTRSDNGSALANGEVTIAVLGVVAQTDAEGNYSLPNVPVGSHTIMGWHEEMEALEKQVTVTANGTATVDFNLAPLEE